MDNPVFPTVPPTLAELS